MNRKQRAMEERHRKRDRQFTESARNNIKIKALPTPEELVCEAIVWLIGIKKAAARGTTYWYNYYTPEQYTAFELYEAVKSRAKDWDTLQSGMMREWKLRQTNLYRALK